MTPAALVRTLEARGVSLQAAGGQLAYEAPPGTLGNADREALRAHKPAVLELLRERQARAVAGTDWRRISPRQLDRVLEIAVPWADMPLILAPGCRLAQDLRNRDPKPGRVWCVCEVIDLLLSGVTPEDARKIGEAKLMFAGTVVGVENADG